MTEKIKQFFGFNKSINNPEYQKMLSDRVDSVFGDKEKITLSELLRKDKSVFEAYKQLDDQGLENFEKIISKDGDASTINEAEYKTLLSVLDAEQIDETNPNAPMLMDGDFSVKGQNNGIYVLDDTDTDAIYNKVDVRANDRIRNLSDSEVQEELQQAIYDAMHGKETNDEYGMGLNSPYTVEMIVNAIKTADKYASLSPNIYTMTALADYFGDKVKASRHYDEKSGYTIILNAGDCSNGEIKIQGMGGNIGIYENGKQIGGIIHSNAYKTDADPNDPVFEHE